MINSDLQAKSNKKKLFQRIKYKQHDDDDQIDDDDDDVQIDKLGWIADNEQSTIDYGRFNFCSFFFQQKTNDNLNFTFD